MVTSCLGSLLSSPDARRELYFPSGVIEGTEDAALNDPLDTAASARHQLQQAARAAAAAGAT
eukprot:CAMPEP_0115055040 /NCGR_PEP_ID=MMETSP0227-20121206/4430_1 /TAXON_ID=89957 /ORGANISM="Polarella glacialis, Strain CCMP 1383" /LENGTH=61 /DNA_ID=CAMNT_0002439585 /DNA_START=143 /DNA_END=329 /DNA_ORIENTATION=-